MKPQGLALLFVPFVFASCEGNGSEIGPAVPDFPAKTVAGQVLAPDGSPIVGALIQLEEASSGNSAVTDRRGRFRFFETPDGNFTLSVDGRTGAANGVGESFPKYRLATTVSGNTHLSRPIFLPDLDTDPNFAASKTVAIGAALTGADDIALAGPGITLVLNGARVDWADPAAHVGESTVRITVALVPTDRLPIPLSSASDGLLGSSAVFWIEPGDLLFSTPAGLTHTSAFFPNGSGNVGLYRYNLGAQDWQKTGSAVVAGGTIAATGLVTHSGFAALGAPCVSSTTVTGRMLNGLSQPLSGVLVTGPSGRATTSALDGTFSLAGVCATDGNGAAANGTFHFQSSTAQFPVSAEKTMALAPGGTTALGDVTLRTEGAGRIDLILIKKGKFVPDQEISIGSNAVSFGARLKTDASGIATFFDVPVVSGAVFQTITGSTDTSSSPPAIEAGGFFFGYDGLFGGSLFTGPAGSFSFNSLGKTLLVTVLREDSEAPIADAFVMVGLDPTTELQGRTDSSGQITFSVTGTPTVTAGVQTTAPAGGGGLDLIRTTSYQTVESVATSTIVFRLPVAQRLGALSVPHRPFGRTTGTASNLTNPLVTPPGNGSGTYAVHLRTSPSGNAKQLFPVLNERSDFDDPSPVGSDNAIGYTPGGALDASYSLAGATPACFLIAVERDSAVAASGPVTRFGVEWPVFLQGGTSLSSNLSLDIPIGANSVSFSAPGLDAALAGLFEADLGVETFTGKGALLGKWTSHLTFTPSTGAGVIVLPPLTGDLNGGTYRFSVSAQQTVGNLIQSQKALFRGSSGPLTGSFLPIPTFSTPTPGGADFSPTVSGLLWAASAPSLMDRVRVTRSASVVESGVNIRDDFDWQIFVPGGDSSAVFPTLPANSVNIPVPAFFSSGSQYFVEVRSLAATYFSYQAYWANAARVRISELQPTAESSYRQTATVP